ncbi:MAG: MFS transporter [Actinobacteria bacterium]|nr:MFS transporter [Actinomycetota bacterium]
MFRRFIDDDNSPVVLRNVDRLAWGRLVSNACYRFAPPFVAVIARGLDVTVGQLGIALMIGEFAGLLSPVIGRRIDRSNRLAGMTFGMSALFVGVVGAAVSPNIIVFTVAMFVLSASKVVFDTALIVWVNDHVPYERRGQVVGVIETSWALGLFIGVSAMGLVTALTNWRIGFGLGALMMAVTGTLILRRLPHHEAHAPASEHVSARIPRNGWLVVAAFFMLLGAAQTIGIVFGPWFEDNFGFSSGAIVAVVVSMGFVELVGSIGSSRVVDRWGKENAVRRGTILMFATCVVMAFGRDTSFIAVPMVVVFFLGFEFGIVCLLPVAANIIPGASGVGLGTAVGAGTFGRAVMSSIATNLYDTVGPVGPALLGAVMASRPVCW